MVEQATFLPQKVEFENLVASMLIINPGYNDCIYIQCWRVSDHKIAVSVSERKTCLVLLKTGDPERQRRKGQVAVGHTPFPALSNLFAAKTLVIPNNQF